jgi:hypothetical protein
MTIWRSMKKSSRPFAQAQLLAAGLMLDFEFGERVIAEIAR